ncbi:PREDICTED: cytochrome c oxidase subunit 7C, mitochondrial [Chaetura pelagica]|nr:PREDICTED: cytochrome c oxidase subunit 7C, mitochondrial [Chaetura pelagica]
MELDLARDVKNKSLQNLPFSVDNKWRLLVLMCGFFGSGFAAPFVIVRHQLLKK